MDFFRRLACRSAVAALAIFASSGTAAASGFALKEQSAAALGNAFAGATAGAEDVSYMFFNPAALGRLEKSQSAAVLSFIAPQAEFQGGSATTAAPFGGTPIAGTTDVGDAADDALVPALYGMWAVGDTLRLGLGVNVPFGLETDYDSDWIGRYHAVHSELRTININPALGWRLFPGMTVGAGFQAQYADAELSNAVDFGTIGAAAGLPGAIPGNPAQDGFAKLEGDDWGYGWNAGILLEPLETTRFGVAYRSKIEHTLEGNVNFSGPAPLLAALRTTGNFVDTGVKADLTTPESWSFGAYHEITPRVAVMAEAALTRWSRFKELRVRFDSPQDDSVTEEDWDDSWFYAVGVTWRPWEGYALRLGVAHDEEPIPDANRTPRIPGEDRTWLAVGTNLQVSPNFSLDLGYTHIWVEDSSLELNAGTSPDHPDFFRGNLTGSYENAIDIVTAQANWRF